MIVVIGCGNANRMDDGIGPAVIRALAGREIARDPRLRLLDAGTDGMAVMFAARDCRCLLIVDACRSAGAGEREPGAVFEIPGSELECPHEPSLTLHDFRWEHALHAGRRLFGAMFPDRITVFLVEARNFDFGIELSPPVAAAVEKVAGRIEALAGVLLHEVAPVP